MFAIDAFESFAGILDVVHTSDPWGLGIKVPVLRAGSPEWADLPMVRGMRKAMIAVVSKGAIGDAMASKNGDLAPASVVERLTSDDVLRLIGASQLPSGDINSLKFDIARVLMTGRDGATWSGVLSGGEPVEYTFENRLRFLGWEGVLLLHSNGNPPSAMTAEALSRIGADTVLGRGIASGRIQAVEFDGNPRTPAGLVRMMPESAPHGGRPVGDAIALWLIAAAEDAERGFNGAVEEAAEVFTGSPSGESDTSAG